MPRTNVTSFAAAQDEVESMITARETLRSVEEMINGASITEDEKAGLWLLAWSMRDRSRLRHDAGAIPGPAVHNQ